MFNHMTLAPRRAGMPTPGKSRDGVAQAGFRALLGWSPCGLQVENGRSCSVGFDFAIFLISRRSGSVKVFGLPPLYFGYSESKPSVLKLWITSLTRSALVNDTSAIFATGMPCADSRTIWARRHVTTDPVPLRMIRSRRCSSSSSMCRT